MARFTLMDKVTCSWYARLGGLTWPLVVAILASFWYIHPAHLLEAHGLVPSELGLLKHVPVSLGGGPRPKLPWHHVVHVAQALARAVVASGDCAAHEWCGLEWDFVPKCQCGDLALDVPGGVGHHLCE